MRINNLTFIAALGLAAAALLAAAEAKPLRWSSQGDILTMDPHAQNEGLNNTVSSYIYEPLATRDRAMKLEPALALSWSQPEPNRWRFVLRQGVKFHDGAPFTADDVVFTIQRAMAPTSNFKIYTQGMVEGRKVDDHIVDIVTNGPNPVLLQQLPELRIMNKAWAEKNRAQAPQNYIEKEDTY